MSVFKAACGHMTTAKRLGEICDQCFANTHAELASLRQQRDAYDKELRRRDDSFAALFAQLEAAKGVLAFTLLGDLPIEWEIRDLAEARINDLLDLREQVRNTCVRAEKAEAELAATRAALGGKV